MSKLWLWTNERHRQKINPSPAIATISVEVSGGASLLPGDQVECMNFYDNVVHIKTRFRENDAQLQWHFRSKNAEISHIRCLAQNTLYIATSIMWWSSNHFRNHRRDYTSIATFTAEWTISISYVWPCSDNRPPNHSLMFAQERLFRNTCAPTPCTQLRWLWLYTGEQHLCNALHRSHNHSLTHTHTHILMTICLPPVASAELERTHTHNTEYSCRWNWPRNAEVAVRHSVCRENV